MEPYYVVDGIPGMSLNLITPEDIDQMMYFTTPLQLQFIQAANGVIVITTKGNKTDRSSVSYSDYVGFDNALAFCPAGYDVNDLRSYASANNITLPNDKGATIRIGMMKCFVRQSATVTISY